MKEDLKFVAFDLDGTLLRERTSCEVVADAIGFSDRMCTFENYSSYSIEEITAARIEMLSWYKENHDYLDFLVNAKMASGVEEGIKHLQDNNIITSIVTITWQEFADWFARKLGINYTIGVTHDNYESIHHFWPNDKPRWVMKKAIELGIKENEIAVIGDSVGDVPMLQKFVNSYFVGNDVPDGLSSVMHYPNGNIHEICLDITDSCIMGSENSHK